MKKSAVFLMDTMDKKDKIDVLLSIRSIETPFTKKCSAFLERV